MKKFVIGIIVVVVLVVVIAALAKKGGVKQDNFEIPQGGMVTMADGKYAVDTAATNVVWKASKVGGSHTGNISVSNGDLTIVDGKPVTSIVTIDMNSMTSTDLTNPEENTKLVNHLKSADFFDTTKYPTARLALSSWEQSPEGLQMVADLTIKGVTKRVTIPVGVQSVGTGFSIVGQITIDQSDYSIVSNKAFDAVVNDEVVLEFTTVWQPK
jgi:polyisoprenoid-binding protein YceI